MKNLGAEEIKKSTRNKLNKNVRKCLKIASLWGQNWPPKAVEGEDQNAQYIILLLGLLFLGLHNFYF